MTSEVLQFSMHAFLSSWFTYPVVLALLDCFFVSVFVVHIFELTRLTFGIYIQCVV